MVRGTACRAANNGSDITANLVTDNLSQKGAEVYIGHSADNISDASVVVISTAIMTIATARQTHTHSKTC